MKHTKSLLLTTALIVSGVSVFAETVTSGYAPVNGLKMYYEIHGQGAMPLVLIHGGGSTIESSFGQLLPLLVPSGPVIALELQAHGRTSDRSAPESFDQDADDVAALLHFLKVTKVNVLGFSNGGSTTMKIAIRHPELVNKIVVISANYRRDGMRPGFFEGMQKATLQDMPPALQAAYLKVAPDKNNLQVMFNKDRERMLTFKDWPDQEIKSIRAPALIMVGDQDVIMPEHAVKLSQLIPNARLIILPGPHGGFIGEAGSNVKDNHLSKMAATLVEDFLKD